MEIKTTTRDGVTVIEISGSLDGNTAPQAQEKIMPLVVPDCRLVLDLGKCNYISSAGLRLLLMVAKEFPGKGGRWVLAGMSEETRDVMEMTGFSGFFKTYDTISGAVKAVQKEAP